MKALLLVDLQKDFCDGGSLAVPYGQMLIPIANKLQAAFKWVVATKDWHPTHHVSFALNHPGRAVGEVIQTENGQQILWPVHCVQHTAGAAFYPGLETTRLAKIFYKGTDPAIDSYSAFFDNAHLRSTGLGEYFREVGVTAIYIMGLATEYCVKYSVLDALHLQFETYVIKDACRGIGLQPDDTAHAWREMADAGAQIVTCETLFYTEPV